VDGRIEIVSAKAQFKLGEALIKLDDDAFAK
jgi:hypothetical protein